MKNFELQPTPQNILETFEQDILGRNIDILRFVELLDSIESSCSIALDARWGAGKTFFVKQTKLVLDAFNECVKGLGAAERECVRFAWDNIEKKNKPEVQPQISVYYDAWINDNDEDPILSLVYSILQSVEMDFSFTSRPDFLGAAAGILEVFSSRSFGSLRETLRSEDPLSRIRSGKSIQSQVAEFLNALLLERGNRLVIFIDELDRCNPTYAVKLLERIKHYFNNDKITFVFSVNIYELQHVIRRIYGNEFDASRYLDRFFDLRIDLPPADMSQFYRLIGLEAGYYVYDSVCKTVIERNHFSLREISKFYRMAKITAYRPTHNNGESEFFFSEGKAMQFCLLFLVPIMLGLKVGDYHKYIAFVSGEDGTPMFDIMNNTEIGKNLRSQLLEANETFSEGTRTHGLKVVNLKDKLDVLYDALFKKDYTVGSAEVRIGQMMFCKKTQESLLRVVSALSKFSDFDV